MELTTVVELIEMLKELPPKAKVFVEGTYGYLHIVEDEDGNKAVSFDDNEEIYFYEEKNIEDEVEMIVIGNKICSKEFGYPYAVLQNGEWILYDHKRNEHTYLPVKVIGTEDDDTYDIKMALMSWGWSINGFEPSDGDLCMM